MPKTRAFQGGGKSVSVVALGAPGGAIGNGYIEIDEADGEVVLFAADETRRSAIIYNENDSVGTARIGATGITFGPPPNAAPIRPGAAMGIDKAPGDEIRVRANGALVLTYFLERND